jgi:two-component system response regulator NreC
MLSLRNDMSIKVLIADDHQIIREGLRSMLEKEHDIKIVGEAVDGRMTERLARELAPNVIIMDVAMPDLNGIEATRQIVAELPGVKIIALSMHDDKRFVLNMLKAGAAGYMLKDSAFTDLPKAIRMVMSGKTYLSQAVTNIVMEDYLLSDGDDFS